VDEPANAQRITVEALRRSLGAELIETHISYVLISDAQAWKIKKALDLGFADFRTLAQRRFYCHEELRLNRRTASQLYVEVLPLTGTPLQPVLGGSGPAIDWVLHMRAFAQEGLWDRLAARGELGNAQVDALVEPLCALHEAAAVAGDDSAYGAPQHVRAPMSDNLQVLDSLCQDSDERATLQQLRDWEEQAFGALQEVFAQRRAAGRVRECHGDLHLGNVTQQDGRPLLFDCLEFSADLRWTDVCSDVAFLAMDLRAHGLDALSHRFVNAYVERSGDAGGLRVLRYYAVHRALVRAKVAALRATQRADGGAEARRSLQHYLQIALQLSQRPTPVLMLTYGFSGSGKTAGTQGLLEACGAIRFRADVERKRLFGLSALQRSDVTRQALL
jgi:aminoglycoside phosphotransferase family enzyme